MQSHLIVLRTTTVGALCASGAVASGIASGPASAWLPYAAIAASTLIMWVLGRTLQSKLLEVQRLGEVTRSHALQMQECTEAARMMAASVADRALAESCRVREHGHAAAATADTADLAEQALARARAVRDDLEQPESLAPAGADTGTDTEHLAAATAASLRATSKLANAAHRMVLNAALDAARTGQLPDFAAPTTALRDLTQRCGEAARSHAALVATLAAAPAPAGAAPAAARAELELLIDQLVGLRRELGAGSAGSAGPTSNQAAADALVALCVDARYIEHELGTLQGARSVEDVDEYQLPPHPLDWDQLDAEVQRDVRAGHETGNIAVLDES